MAIVAQYKDQEGYQFIVRSTMYLDWGLEIRSPSNDELFYSPSALCIESYGIKPAEKYSSWEEAEDAHYEGDLEAFVTWDDSDWRECLESQSSELLEAFCFDFRVPNTDEA